MKKINPLVKFSSWVFILVGIAELAGIVFLITKGGTRLSDFFAGLFIDSGREIIFCVAVIIIRMMMGTLGLLETWADACISMALFLVIKDFIFMYFFYTTNIYVFLYRSIPELILVILYLLGRVLSKYAVT